MKLNETRLVILLCILAGIRVLIFTAAFPFFNNVDEGAHHDMIRKYMAGHIPARIEHYSRESAAAYVYSSPEYNLTAEMQWPEALVPLWRPPEATAKEAIPVFERIMAAMTNHESTQFSLYYVLAGVWYDLGKALGIEGGVLLYWLRFLNIPIYSLLVWVAYLMTRKLSPGNLWLNLGVPLTLVVFPQDVFYGLNSDVLSALLATWSLYLLITYLLENRGIGFCILTGVSVAAAFLAKPTNLPMLIIFGGIVAAKTVRLRTKGRVGQVALRLAAIVPAAVLPIGAWLLRNQLVLGDLSACHAKIVRMGWTLKPFGQIFNHPMFTAHGILHFWSETIKSLWRGEIIWHMQRIALPAADSFYIVSSTAFLMAAAILAWKRKDIRFASVMNFLVLGISVAFLAGLSLIYDFNNCMYPSREVPFFSSGRLILGALVPFIMLYLTGLGAIMDWLKVGKLRWTVVSLLLLLMLVSEISISASVFASAFNFYHLFGG